MDEAKSQRAARSIGYRRRYEEYPRIERLNECSLEFVRRLYFDDHRSFQCLLDTNDYFVQTAVYNKFKIKRQDIDVFDLQFPNPKGQRVVTDGSRLVFIDVYNFIKYV